MEIRKASERGVTNQGWLNSRHTFSFGEYFDPHQVGFSDLLVINDDIVQAGGGFGTHPHRDMEIFSYVLSGSLQHKDSMGTGSVISPGDVQLMTAGTGVLHSEFNARSDEPVHFLQVWIVPDKKGYSPCYQQANFSEEKKRGRLCLAISSSGEEGALQIHQNTRVWIGRLDGNEEVKHSIPTGRFAYLHVAEGSLVVNGVRCEAGDGVRFREEKEIHLAQGEKAHVLVFDLEAKEIPDLRRI